MQKQCAQCGKPFDYQKPTAKFCSGSCRATFSKTKPAESPPPETIPARPVSGLVEAVMAELEALERLDTVTGRHALELASRIVSAPGMNAGVASLSKELSRVLAEVRSKSTVVANPLDELKARRDHKRRTG